MKLEDFYSIDFNSNNAELFVEVIGEYEEQKLLTGELEPGTLRLKKSQGRKAYDIVRLQDVFNFLISSKLLTAFQQNNLTGWQSYNIELDIDIGAYKGFQCLGKCGTPIRPKESGFVTGYSFNVETWDGSDFFIPETTLSILCTRKAKEVIEPLNIKNIEITNLKTLEWYNA